ncbi:jg23598 [Pararge aegeria aegeria]|uniref:Jg23598 protein n=1 Tax=Pararge aegeria aegeria TaxID=348720 RepID=A0A8S4SH77_9NEOP|nr:jg23598 [Pararge aegeria aegeria]
MPRIRLRKTERARHISKHEDAYEEVKRGPFLRRAARYMIMRRYMTLVA